MSFRDSSGYQMVHRYSLDVYSSYEIEQETVKQECIPVGCVPTAAVATVRCQYWGRRGIMSLPVWFHVPSEGSASRDVCL